MSPWLVGRGIDPTQARAVAGASGGRLDRAELLVGDPGLAARQEQWREVPTRLGRERCGGRGSGRGAAGGGGRGIGPPTRTARTRAGRAGRAGRGGRGQGNCRPPGDRGSPRSEERRWRTDDLRFGLATLAGVYHDRLVTGRPDRRRRRLAGPHSGPSAGRPTGSCHRAGHRGPAPQSQRVTPYGRVMVTLSGMDE